MNKLITRILRLPNASYMKVMFVLTVILPTLALSGIIFAAAAVLGGNMDTILMYTLAATIINFPILIGIYVVREVI